MPAQQNSPLRVIVPLLVLAASAGFILVVLTSTPPTQTPTPSTSGSSAPTQQPAQTQGAAQPSAGAQDSAAQPDPATDQPEATGAEDTAPIESTASPDQQSPDQPSVGASQPTASAPVGLRARAIDDTGAPASLGSLDPQTGHRALVSFTPFGAGVESIIMTDFFKSVRKKDHYELQRVRSFVDGAGRTFTLTSLAARQITIDGQAINLFNDPSRQYARLWRETAPGSFECLIVDGQDQPVLRLQRTYSLAPGSFELLVQQTIENLTDQPHSIQWVQYGPIELPEDISGYRIRVRRMRFGFLWDPQRDPTQQIVRADAALRTRESIISTLQKGDSLLWPRPSSYKHAGRAVWLAQTSRYFAFAVHPLADPQDAASNLANPASHPLEKAFDLALEVNAIMMPDQSSPGQNALLTQMTSTTMLIEPGRTLDLSFGAYAGPLGRRQLSAAQNPVFGAFGLDEMVIYNIGGPCAFCTFQWLARLLIAFLMVIHDYVVFDWALAIMLLVVCVRVVLHPVTKKSQIGLMRFSKQMQRIAPKQQKLKEKYRDDSKQLNQEMMKLMKEEGVNYAGALGCLPMFLQTPIWIALYAMLYFSFDLRHRAAFFGVFQNATGGSWPFLSDLSSADNFIPFGGASISIPLMGVVAGFNILPILLGFVFYVQQKYLTPPPSAALSPEQQTQQKMIKVMMVVFFPLVIYNAPSGLSIYFITNSMLGILESRYIRAHVDKLDLESSPKQKPARKKIASKAQQPANPFRKDRAEYRKQFKSRR